MLHLNKSYTYWKHCTADATACSFILSTYTAGKVRLHLSLVANWLPQLKLLPVSVYSWMGWQVSPALPPPQPLHTPEKSETLRELNALFQNKTPLPQPGFNCLTQILAETIRAACLWHADDTDNQSTTLFWTSTCKLSQSFVHNVKFAWKLLERKTIWQDYYHSH